MPREGRDVDVGSELEVSRLDAPGRSEPPALDRAPRPGEAEDPDALHRAFGDIGERTGASGSRSDAGSLSSASSSGSHTASAAIVELEGMVDRPAEARAKHPGKGEGEGNPPDSETLTDRPDDEPPPSPSPRPSFRQPRLSRQKSWGSAKIARLDEEARADSLRETKRRAAQRSLPLFSKLRYVLLCGEPLAAERMLSARLRRMSAAAPRAARRDGGRNPRGSFFSFFSRSRDARRRDAVEARRTHGDHEENSAGAVLFETNDDETFETHWWMIHPFSRFRRRWDVAVVVATAYVAMLAPFVIGFDVNVEPGSSLYAFDRCADAAFILDVFLNYLTGYVESNRGRVVLEPRAVAWTYTKTWAPLDVLASVPFDLVFPDERRVAFETDASYDASYDTSHDASHDASYDALAPPPPGAFLAGTSSRADAAYRGAKVVRVIKLIRLLKLFRVLRVTRALARLERGLSVRYGAWQIVKFICVVLTLAHWQACAWFLTHAVQKSAFVEPSGRGGEYAAYGDAPDDVATWVDVLAETQGTAPETLDDQSRFAKYAACVYWATTTMTTIGYGDIVPVTSVERVVVIFAQLIGSCVFLYGLTQVTALVADNASGDVEFQRVLDDANAYFEKRAVPTSLRVKVREHLRHRRFFFASASVGGGGGFEEQSGSDDGHGFFSKSGSSFTPYGSYAEDAGERRVLSKLSLEVRREVRLWSMRDVLNQQPFFRDDPEETFVKLCTDSLRRRFFGPNEYVFRAGDVGRELFFLSRGDAEARTRRGRRVRALPEGAMFGEIALVLSMKRDEDEESRNSSQKRQAPLEQPVCAFEAEPPPPVRVRRNVPVRRTADVRTKSGFVETLALSDAAYRRAAAAAPRPRRRWNDSRADGSKAPTPSMLVCQRQLVPAAKRSAKREVPEFKRTSCTTLGDYNGYVGDEVPRTWLRRGRGCDGRRSVCFGSVRRRRRRRIARLYFTRLYFKGRAKTRAPFAFQFLSAPHVRQIPRRTPTRGSTDGHSRIRTMRVTSSVSTPFHERSLVPRFDRVSLVGATRRPHRRRRRVVTWRASGTPRDAFVPATWRDLNIDWGRRHLQVVFVDANHGVLARSAEGVCARVAIWAGAGHMVFPESAGLDVKSDKSASSAPGADDAMRLLTRLAPVCDHPRYATRAPYAFTDADAACADLVVTLGGAAVERAAVARAPSAANVVDLLEFARFAPTREIDGTGAAAILQRSLAKEVCAPMLNDALALTPGEAWGLVEADGCAVFEEAFDGASDDVTAARRARSASAAESADSEAQASLRLARARVVIGVVGLIAFLLATAPIEEVERVTKR